MWAKNIFFKLFFFVPGPFQGGHFFGGEIYFSALDLRPAPLNLRPALLLASLPLVCVVFAERAVLCVVTG